MNERAQAAATQTRVQQGRKSGTISAVLNLWCCICVYGERDSKAYACGGYTVAYSARGTFARLCDFIHENRPLVVAMRPV